MIQKFRKHILIGALILLSGSVGVIYLKCRGHIPSFTGTEDGAYEKQVGVRPSFGRIWQHSVGFVDGFCYYRLHLTQRDFDATDIAKLKRLPELPHPEESAPIWWNPSRDTALTFTRGGLGSNTKNLYIYDSRRQLLFARCEWD